jgi:hypothetical protein
MFALATPPIEIRHMAQFEQEIHRVLFVFWFLHGVLPSGTLMLCVSV